MNPSVLMNRCRRTHLTRRGTPALRRTPWAPTPVWGTRGGRKAVLCINDNLRIRPYDDVKADGRRQKWLADD
jgi:hypothetical protein